MLYPLRRNCVSQEIELLGVKLALRAVEADVVAIQALQHGLEPGEELRERAGIQAEVVDVARHTMPFEISKNFTDSLLKLGRSTRWSKR